MKTLRLVIDLTYDDYAMHSGDDDSVAKDWFLNTCLLHPPDRLILHSNDIGDEVGDVRVVSISDPEAIPCS